MIHIVVRKKNQIIFTYHSILRYPLAQQCKLLNCPNTEYSFETISFVNCICVELSDSLNRFCEQWSNEFTTLINMLNIITTKIMLILCMLQNKLLLFL